MRFKDGKEWRIGGAAEVAWIEAGIKSGLAITAAIPPIYAAYCTLTLPGPGRGFQRRHDRAVMAILDEHSQGQPWLLGYLETGPSAEVVFYDAPRVKLYTWDYVLVQAGPEQALNWRQSEQEIRPAPERPTPVLAADPTCGRPRAPSIIARTSGGWYPWKGALPELMFPADHAWLFSTLWDDDWSCIGGSEALIESLIHDPELGPRTRPVALGEDATPPGHSMS